MRTVILTLTLHASWVRSLKDKRMELKSLLTRLRSRWNVSVCEAEQQDTHQIMVIGAAVVAPDTAQVNRVADAVIRFVEQNTEAELVRVERELL